MEPRCQKLRSPTTQDVIAHGEAVTFIQAPAVGRRPEHHDVDVLCVALQDHRRQKRGPEPVATKGFPHVETADVAVTLGLNGGIRKLFDQLEPDGAARETVELGDASPPRAVAIQARRHPGDAAIEKCGFGFFHGHHAGAELVSQSRQEWRISGLGAPDVGIERVGHGGIILTTTKPSRR